MKTLLFSGLMGAVVTCLAVAQTGTPAGAAASAASSSVLPSGTIISVELTKSLDAKKAKPGDPIECKLPADVLAHGQIVIPRDTKIMGHVTDVKANSKESPGAKVGIAFDRMTSKKGGDVPLQLTVQALGRPLVLVDSPAHMNEGASVPSGAPSTAGGTGMGASSPSRAQERVAAIPIDAGGSDRDAPPPTTMAPLGPTSKGVVGIKGLSLEVSEKAAVISSATGNVHLDGGTQMILRVQ